MIMTISNNAVVQCSLLIRLLFLSFAVYWVWRTLTRLVVTRLDPLNRSSVVLIGSCSWMFWSINRSSVVLIGSCSWMFWSSLVYTNTNCQLAVAWQGPEALKVLGGDKPSGHTFIPLGLKDIHVCQQTFFNALKSVEVKILKFPTLDSIMDTDHIKCPE